MNEGSLTFPGISVIIKRPVSITVEYYNKNGEIQQNEFRGLTARIFQHAFDHLQGTTMKDRVSKLKWDMATKRLNNYKQKLVKKYTQKKLLEIKKAMEEQTNGNT
jgi:peptide deformylase